MAHHKMGDVGDGALGSWGFPEGGMGGLTAAMAAAARSFGAEIRTEATVERITVHDGAVTGVVLDGGDELTAPLVVTTVHPKLAFLQLLDRRDLPADFVDDIERWHTRSGTVKINLAVDRLPEFTAKPGLRPRGARRHHRAGPQPRRGGAGVPGRRRRPARGAALRRHLHPVGVRPHAGARRATTSCRCSPSGCPHEWAAAPHTAELDAYADTVVATMEEVAPGFADSILHRTVIGPYEMEHTYGLVGGNIFHGELSPNQLFHLRPAPGLGRLPHADPRAVPGRLGHPRGRRRDRHPGAQRRAPDRAGRAAQRWRRRVGRSASGAVSVPMGRGGAG